MEYKQILTLKAAIVGKDNVKWAKLTCWKDKSEKYQSEYKTKPCLFGARINKYIKSKLEIFLAFILN